MIQMATNYEKIFEKDYQKLSEKLNKKTNEYKELKHNYSLLERRYTYIVNKVDEIKEETYKKVSEKYDNVISEKDKIIAEKDMEIERLKALLNMDGTSTGMPTSQTPINKNKIIPNSREKTNKKVGGQKGHEKHKLEKFEESEVNEHIEHELEKCPCCNGSLTKVGEKTKDELSYKFITIKRRHHFIVYKCTHCHKEVHESIPVRLKEDNQYGSEIQAVALSLANEGNVPMNKIRKIIKGYSHEEIDMSEGYIAKLQKRASNNLKQFKEDLFKKLLTKKLLYWDDTVISIDKKRACLRFYGDEKLAYYTAHLTKGEKGLEEDGILKSLSKNVTLMHDHNKVNYKYKYQNIECNEHLIRDLQKCTNNANHEWSSIFKRLVQKIIHDRKSRMVKGFTSFEQEYINKFDDKFNSILYDGITENLTKPKTHYDSKEKALLNRILEFKDNYFIWMYDFSLPIDNNLSERALRGVKSKMKIAGQFKNINYARYYADIKTYIETCYRNGLNPTKALIRLMEDNPYSLEEILSYEKNDEIQ